MRSPLNTPVLAAAAGKVLNRTDTGSEGYGKAIRLIHDGGWITTYGHLNAYAGVDAGDSVAAGQMIGFSGDSGNSNGAHLHFTLANPALTFTDSQGNRWPKGIHDPTPYLAPLMDTSRDMLPYLMGDGRIYQMRVMWQGQEHSQQMQTQADGDTFYLVKNSEWEQLFVGSDHILRGIDTSPGNGLYYWQRRNVTESSAPWCPRRWAVGGLYERNPLVTFYRKDTGYPVPDPAPGYRRSWLRYSNHYSSWRSSRGGLSFSDVAEFQWLLSPAGTPAETYYYARDIGLVGWLSSSGDYSFVTEMFLPGQRQPMMREKIVVR